jgi:hypothetical protein
MPISARRVAGIIRNVLPRQSIERQPRIILGSREELINRRVQIRKWETQKAKLMKTQPGRKLLAQHFPASYQKALLAKQSPNTFKSSRSNPVRVNKDLESLFPAKHQRIMLHKTPQIPRTPNFKVGTKKVYLPNIIITLRRNTKLEPYHAVFDVPLNLSKLDLRDYLWHLYGVKTISIRSSILPGILRRKYAGTKSAQRWGPMRRTKARKKMIVQLAKPFRYPRELNRRELDEYLWSYWADIDFKRKDMIDLRDGIHAALNGGSWVLCRILTLCTMYTTNGARIACVNVSDKLSRLSTFLVLSTSDIIYVLRREICMRSNQSRFAIITSVLEFNRSRSTKSLLIPF